MIELQTVWGWQPALYLFFGGLGAGTFLVSALIHVVTRAHVRTVRIGMWASVACLVVGLILLITEVTGPFRAMMLWQSFTNLPSSWMAIGCWLLFVGLVDFALAALAMTPALCKLVRLSDGAASKIALVAAVLGMPLALGVAIYTGILLQMAPGIPFWGSSYLPLLFAISAMDTGIALVEIIALVFEPRSHRMVYKLEVSALVLILLEVGALVLYVSFMLGGGNVFLDTLEVGYSATAIASVESWLGGQLAVAFWGLFVALGLAAPFAIALYSTLAAKPKGGRTLAIVGASCVLVGGCTLRFITILAGAHVDVIANAVGALL